jgi:integrase
VDLPASITKSGRNETVPLVEALAEAFRAARANTPDHRKVFRGIPKMETFRKDLKAAGIQEVDGRGRRAVLHSLRHSLCTMMAASGVPMAVAQRVMRHSDIRLTAQHYCDEGMLPMAEAVRELPVLSLTGGAKSKRRTA